MPEKLVIEFKSNLRPEENSWELRTADGTVVFANANFTANTIYRDTLNLAAGCYEFQFLDEGQDGLNWWANTAQGTGYLRLKNGNTGATIRTFNPDFGGEVYQQFRVNAPTRSIANVMASDRLHIWPNPTSGKVNFWWDESEFHEGQLSVRDLQGKLIFRGKVLGESILDVASWPAGMYNLEVNQDGRIRRGKFIKQ
jgi:hypothetical protein